MSGKTVVCFAPGHVSSNSHACLTMFKLLIGRTCECDHLFVLHATFHICDESAMYHMTRLSKCLNHHKQRVCKNFLGWRKCVAPNT